MSTPYNEELIYTDHWSLVVECHDAEGNLLTLLSSAVMTMKTYEDVEVLTVNAGSADMLIEGAVVKVTVDSEGLDPEIFHDGALFKRKLQVMSNSVRTTQVDGVVVIGWR